MTARDENVGADRAEGQRAFARWWSGHPACTGLRDRLAGVDVPGAARLIAAALPLIEDIAWIEELVARAARGAAADPWFEPPLRALDHTRQLGLVLFDDRRLRISVHALPLEAVAAHKAAVLGPRSVVFTGTQTLTRIVRSAGAEIDLWHADPAGSDFAAARAGRCRPAGRLVLHDGQMLAIDGAQEAWTIARQRGDVLIVQATARDVDAPLAVEYDAATGGFLAASAIDGSVARLQLMATLLRLMDRRDAAGALAEAAKESPFFLRWHLARELVALDAAAAAPLLRRLATEDDHPEVRRAASRTLALIAA